jgi:hypothetical protein
MMAATKQVSLIACAVLWTACGRVPAPEAVDAPTTDASSGASGPPPNVRYTYVVDHVQFVPDSTHTAAALGLDLGSPSGPALDGKVDNQLGSFFVRSKRS